MKTITANIKEGIDQEIITEAGSILKDGGLVAFPTETVYGLGGNALDEQAAEKIYAAKGRPSDNPLIVHIAEFEALNKIAAEIPEEAKMLADAFWPGPLTMIFQKTDLVPMGTTGGLNTDRNKPRNKPFTFCTKSSFEGVDFYSDNASTYIFINAGKEWQIWTAGSR